MVLGITHALFGIFIGVASGASLAQGIFAVLGSVFPDIDTKRSYLGRFFKPMNIFMGHRGITHSLLAMVVLSILIAIAPIEGAQKYAYFFLLGYASHLVLDVITKEGITPFFPYKKFRIKSKVKVGGLLEKLFFVLVLFGIIKTVV